MYNKEIKDDESLKKAQELANTFANHEGRRPRILMADMEQNASNRGIKVIAAGFADVGFDVDIGPLCQSPKDVAKQAIENDVHILSISSLATEHKTLIQEVVAILKTYDREDIIVIVTGNIPKPDYKFYIDSGVSFVYGSDTKTNDSAIELLEHLLS